MDLEGLDQSIPAMDLNEGLVDITLLDLEKQNASKICQEYDASKLSENEAWHLDLGCRRQFLRYLFVFCFLRKIMLLIFIVHSNVKERQRLYQQCQLKDIAMLEIQMEPLTKTITKKQKTTYIDKIGIVGGMIGVFIGVSLLDVMSFFGTLTTRLLLLFSD